MNTYTVQAVGEPMGLVVTIEAYNALYAVAEVAGCDLSVVTLPIWRRGPDAWNVSYEVECYMPLDNTGRQWLVREVTP
jgi:hypothetical protein